MAAQRGGSACLGRQLVQARCGADVARERAQQCLHSYGVTSNSVDLADVGARDVVEIAPQCGACVTYRHAVIETRPATSTECVDCLGHAMSARTGFSPLAAQETGKRHFLSGQPSLGERHGAQSKSLDAQRARVAGEVIGRCGRAGQNELACLCSSVALASNCAPQHRHALPFVDQSGSGTVEYPVRFGLCQCERGRILLEQRFAVRETLRQPRLSAALRPFNEQCTSGSQHPCSVHLGNAAAVSRRCETQCGLGRLTSGHRR